MDGFYVSAVVAFAHELNELVAQTNESLVSSPSRPGGKSTAAQGETVQPIASASDDGSAGGAKEMALRDALCSWGRTVASRENTLREWSPLDCDTTEFCRASAVGGTSVLVLTSLHVACFWDYLEAKPLGEIPQRQLDLADNTGRVTTRENANWRANPNGNDGFEVKHEWFQGSQNAGALLYLPGHDLRGAVVFDSSPQVRRAFAQFLSESNDAEFSSSSRVSNAAAAELTRVIVLNDHDCSSECSAETLALDPPTRSGRITRYLASDDFRVVRRFPDYLDHAFYYPQDLLLIPAPESEAGSEVDGWVDDHWLLVADGAHERVEVFGAQSGMKKHSFENPYRWPWELIGFSPEFVMVVSDDTTAAFSIPSFDEVAKLPAECAYLENANRVAVDNGIVITECASDEHAEKFGRHALLLLDLEDPSAPLCHLDFGASVQFLALDPERGVLIAIIGELERIFVFDLTAQITKSARKIG